MREDACLSKPHCEFKNGGVGKTHTHTQQNKNAQQQIKRRMLQIIENESVSRVLIRSGDYLPI